MVTAPAFPPAPDMIYPKRALISLSDKAGLIEAATALITFGIEIISTGGTRVALEKAGLAVRDVADLTGFPEMMDGRVKTLHPKVHGGILGYRDAPDHARAMAEHDIAAIDIVWIDLYPFEATVASGAGADSVVENIDIGGPAMIRSSAKNHAYVSVCVDKAGMAAVLTALETQKAISFDLRHSLAAKAFARTASYDAAVATWFSKILDEAAPERKIIAGSRIQTMRYGENPHQTAAFYKTSETRPGVATARQHQGKALSYNNVCDTDAALELVAEFDPKDQAACVIIKHANPCGVAVGASLLEAYERALSCDDVSAFGGIVALNRPLDIETAQRIIEIFTEVVMAPGLEPGVEAIFATKKNLRLLTVNSLPDPMAPGETFRSVSGGFLIQGRDTARILATDLKIVTKRHPTPTEIADMLFAFTIAKHVKSNAIVYAKDGRSAGIGAGQMTRRDSARIAALRAREAGDKLGLGASLAQGSACASEAFFPFPDGLIEAASAGATAIIQPGGSVNDPAVIEAADAHNLAMAFTGVRVFRH